MEVHAYPNVHPTDKHRDGSAAECYPLGKIGMFARMNRMRKLFHVMAISTLAAGWCLVVSVQAEPVVELHPSSVIAIDRLNPVGKLPVVSAVAFAPRPGLLVIVGDDHLVRIGGMGDGMPLPGFRSENAIPSEKRLSAHQDWVRSAVLSSSGQILATAGFDCQIILWDTSSGEQIQQFSAPGSCPRALAFGPNGQTLAAAGFDDQVRLFDVSSGQPLMQLAAPGGNIRTVSFSPDGSCLAAAGRVGVVRIWEVSSGNVLREFNAGRRIDALAYSPDGQKIVAGGEGPDILIWETATGNLFGRLPARPGKVMAVAFCGANRLAAGGSQNTIGVWDLVAQEQELSLVGHTGSVTSLAWNAESGVLISGSFDTTVRTWQLSGGAVNAVPKQ
jgi:WD40 repeat protein